jgi:uncharacterized protein (DUF58 family)
VLFSDFYEAVPVWASRLRLCAAAGAQAALVAIADPAEEDFPYQGRVRFEDSTGRQEALFGRAEDARAAYQARLAEHRASLRALAADFGFAFVVHRTDRHPGPVFAELCARLAERPR